MIIILHETNEFCAHFVLLPITDGDLIMKTKGKRGEMCGENENVGLQMGLKG